MSTIRRRLKKFAYLETWRLPRRRKPHPANPLLRDVPMGRIPWDEQEPGHFEADLVHHCGHSASGDDVHTVQLIDVATGWCEQLAVLGRSQRVMQDAFQRILARLPFPVHEIHPDNGTEFFHDHLLRFWKDALQGVRISRSRPLHKNDNRFVEQKNNSQVRYYLGHERLDTVAHTLLLNRIYEKLWIYHNLFQPVLRMKEKRVATDAQQSGRVTRRFDAARTPFERLCATTAISPQRRAELQRLREQTNPRRLREEIYQLLDELFSLPGATPGVTENALDTLSIPIPT